MKTTYPLSSKLDHPDILETLFHPRQDRRPASPPVSEDHFIETGDADIKLSCRFYSSVKDAPTILYFHGNGEVVPDYDMICSEYTSAGFHLFMATYRGYGGSDGSPTVTALMKDNVVIANYLKEYLQRSSMSEACFVMGRSLGSASAIDLAFRHPDLFKGLILDSGFADTVPLVSRLGLDITAYDIVEDECFNNLGKIQKVTMPTLLLHGSRDHIIPVAEAEKLQAESGAKTKQFHIIPGADHNSLLAVGGPLYFETIKKFTDTVMGKNTWRQRRRAFKNKETSE